MKSILLIVSLCVLENICPAQQKPMPKLSPLAQCRVNEQGAVDALVDRIAERDKLQSENKELESRNAELTKKYEELRTAAKDVLTYTQELDVHYRKMLDDYKSLLDDYNGAIRRASYTDAIQQTNAQRQQRFSNALALYQAMPKYQPPQTINVNVSDCTKLPALCAGH
jgi:chromosome segregation ATPase